MAASVKMSAREADALLDRAFAAAAAAAAAATPSPMVVSEAEPLTGRPKAGGRSWFVSEGPVGFAWVTVRPARGALVAAAKRRGLGALGYRGGWVFWSPGFSGQSIARAEAAAFAFADVLREGGVRAWADSRLD